MNWFLKMLGAVRGQHSLRPREPRVALAALHRISFRSVETQRKHLLGNISTGGLSLLEPGETYAIGDTLAGQLEIEADHFNIKGHIRHVTPRMAGVEFSSPDGALLAAIENYLRLEFLAMRLRSVNESYLKKDARGKVVWLSDGKQNEIHAVLGPNGLVDFQLSFLGHHVHADESSKIQIGMISEHETTSRGHKGSSLIVDNAVAPQEVRRLALAFVTAATDLPEDVRSELAARLTSRSNV